MRRGDSDPRAGPTAVLKQARRNYSNSEALVPQECRNSAAIKPTQQGRGRAAVSFSPKSFLIPSIETCAVKPKRPLTVTYTAVHNIR